MLPRLFRLSGVFLLLLFTITAFAETPQSDLGFNVPIYKSDQTINCHACKAKNLLDPGKSNVSSRGDLSHINKSDFSLYHGNLIVTDEKITLFSCRNYHGIHNLQPT